MKITALEESADFATLDTEKLFSKLKSHELSKKGRPNHDASLISKTFVTSTRVGSHVANPTNTIDSSALEFALSSLCTASTRRGGGLLGTASSAVTPPTSLPTAPRGRSSTPPTRTTTTNRTTPATRVRARRTTTSGIRRIIRSSRR
jgi:hypothetical protein